MPTAVPLLIRVFVEVPDDIGAQRAVEQLVTLLEAIGTVLPSPVKNYWKIPEYYEVRVRLEPDQHSDDLLSVVARRLGSGWSTGGATWQVWNAGADTAFAIDNARWAHVEILE